MYYITFIFRVNFFKVSVLYFFSFILLLGTKDFFLIPLAYIRSFAFLAKASKIYFLIKYWNFVWQ